MPSNKTWCGVLGVVLGLLGLSLWFSLRVRKQNTDLVRDNTTYQRRLESCQSAVRELRSASAQPPAAWEEDIDAFAGGPVGAGEPSPPDGDGERGAPLYDDRRARDDRPTHGDHRAHDDGVYAPGPLVGYTPDGLPIYDTEPPTVYSDIRSSQAAYTHVRPPRPKKLTPRRTPSSERETDRGSSEPQDERRGSRASSQEDTAPRRSKTSDRRRREASAARSAAAPDAESAHKEGAEVSSAETESPVTSPVAGGDDAASDGGEGGPMVIEL